MTNPTAAQAHGLLYIGRRPRPATSINAQGLFQLTFDVIDCQGPLAKESWTLTWSGREALMFWDANREALRTAGQPLKFSAHRLRAHVAGRIPGIHAHVLTLELAPRHAPAESIQPETYPA